MLIPESLTLLLCCDMYWKCRVLLLMAVREALTDE